MVFFVEFLLVFDEQNGFIISEFTSLKHICSSKLLTMFDYKIIRIPVSMWTGKPKEDYLSVIKEYAAEGWRFIQVFNPSRNSAGNYYIEVIFEKKRKEE